MPQKWFKKELFQNLGQKNFGEELALDVDSVLDNLVDPVLAGLVDQVPKHEAGEVCVELLVPREQLLVEVVVSLSQKHRIAGEDHQPLRSGCWSIST